MSNLPNGWAGTTLGDICSKPQYGWTCSASSTGTLRYIRTTDISSGRINWDRVPFCLDVPENLEKYRIQKNDILVSRAGSVGISYRIEEIPVDAVFASYLIRFKPLEWIIPKYIEFYLKSESYWRSISDFTAGIAVPNVNASKLAEVKIPLAPINEQRRIVAKLEKLLAKVDTCKERLDKIPGILKRFRQSVLSAACSGRLTADWRENNPDVESAEELFRKNLKESSSELPLNWYLVSVGDVITSLKYGTSQKCSYDSNGVPVLRIPNVSKGAIDQSDLKYAELSEKEYEELKLFPGDILLIRSNGSVSLVGKSALIGKADKDFAYAGYLIRLRPNPQLIDPTYLNMVLSSYDVRLQIEIPARSTSGVNNINSQEVKQLKIPVSPLSEQQEIVRRVQTLFKTADQIEQRYQKARGYVDQLTQSILAKAFRGELVPQDPNDEPASVLLEQIRAEQAKREAEAKAAKKSTGKKGGRRGRKPKPQGSEPIQLELPGLE
ncbi:MULTISPECIES: restriction endonuclease subunit S [Cyanophyceae]|uniref:restriction endonuclease subunit S n=1 Tax=Cyanophyceae TaxID=3028117 RepID=UPI001688C12F|nr:restriction endonuclease subunit S [Trichocoleus sp. FACHB-40]